MVVEVGEFVKWGWDEIEEKFEALLLLHMNSFRQLGARMLFVGA